ncbi:unnamed protein product [Dicrocoelium dendriticum]|nr:unnamed protein product [Dicrocoelium dendriticum]
MERDTDSSESTSASDSEKSLRDEEIFEVNSKPDEEIAAAPITRPNEYAVVLKATSCMKSEAMVVRLAPSHAFCAVGLANGEIQFFQLASQINRATIATLKDANENLSCTDICFSRNAAPDSKDGSCLLASYASGYIRLWHYHGIGSKQLLVRSWKESICDRTYIPRSNPMDDANQIFCISISEDNKRFISGGLDARVRVYNKGSTDKGRILQPSTSDHTAYGHTSRVTALAYHPRGRNNPHYASIFVSASWDDTIRIWDEQQGNSLWEICGPHVVGNDGMDIDPTRNVILTCSWRREKSLLQVWEFPERVFESPYALDRDGRKTRQKQPLYNLMHWTREKISHGYVAKFDPTYRHILFAGSNKNIIDIFEIGRQEVLAELDELSHGVYSAAIFQNLNCENELKIVYTNGKTINLCTMIIKEMNASSR